MSEIYLTFQNENFKFNYRVAGIFLKNKSILLQSSKNDSSYYLIGGRVKLGENIISAMIREIKEETGITIKENSFNQWISFKDIQALPILPSIVKTCFKDNVLIHSIFEK